MSFSRAVSYELSGPLERAPMESLRTSLDLVPHGRFTDDQDAIFGSRTVSVPGGRVEFLLVRDDDRDGWDVGLNTDGNVDPEELRPFEAEILAAAAAAGVTVVSVFRPR